MRLLTAIVECSSCALEFEGGWPDDSLDAQDRVEVPIAEQQCPGCGHIQEEPYPGWSFQSEAG